MRQIFTAKKIMTLSVLLFGSIVAAIVYWQYQSASVADSLQNREKAREVFETKERFDALDKDFNRKHSDPSGKVRPDLWRKGVEDYRRMSIAAGVKSNVEGLIGGIAGVQWKQVGPGPLANNSDASNGYAGEVTDIAIDPRNSTDQVIYISVNDGGIWKSTDGGRNWTPKTDFMPSLSMGAVALDPGNPSIVYAGTGNVFNNGFFKAIGIYKSIDGGETWIIINPGNIFNNIGINRIVVPASNILVVGTSNGIYRSMDGGLSFGNNAPLFNNGDPFFAGAFISDLKVDTALSSTVYAGVSGQGMFFSTDSGASFPLTNNLFNNPVAPTAGSYYNVHFDQSTLPDNKTFYATVELTDCTTLKLFKSTNSGSSWTNPAATGLGGFQCGYDDEVGVDPQNPNRIYIGLVDLFRSENGGMSFSGGLGQVHVDYHAIEFSPRSHFGSNPKTPVYVGNDGGIATSPDGAGDNFKHINSGMATLLFRQIDVGRGSPDNNSYTYGGMQDNGIGTRSSMDSALPTLKWRNPIDCCDGFTVAVDPSDPKKAYSNANGGINRTSDGGVSAWEYFGVSSKFLLAVDPNNSMIVYTTSDCSTEAGCPGSPAFFFPGSQLFRSMDRGETFTMIHKFPAPIQSLAIADIDSNVLWVGLGNGSVQRTANALAGASANWVPLTVMGATNQAVEGLAIDPTNTDQVVIAYGGFTGTLANRTRHVFRTTDNGVNWTNISGTIGAPINQNLPDLPLHSVVIDPGTFPHTIIVASDAGVMRTANLGATWEVFGLGLPTVDCTSLALDYKAVPPLLRVGTYGRSVFELSAASGPLLGVNAETAFGPTCNGQSTTRQVELFNVGSSDLHISSFIRISGSSDFQLVSGPATPVTIPPGEHLNFTIRFHPTGVGDETSVFQINCDDPTQPARQLMVSGTGTTRSIATIIADSGNFGAVCLDSFKDLDLTISNSGLCDLRISNITVSPGADFLLPFPPATPLIIHGGDSLVVPIRFQPASKGSKSALIRVFSDDPMTPIKTVSISGIGQASSIIVNDPITFDKTCPGNTNNKTLTIGNSGQCDLVVKSIISDSPEFKVVGVVPFPLVIPPGSTRDVTIQFMPMGFTVDPMRMARLTIMSNDPDVANKVVKVIGIVPPPIIQAMPDPLDFGKVCLGKSKELPLTIKNNGECNLTVSSITFSSTEFKLLPPPTFPIVVPPGGARILMVSFMPVGATGPRLETMSINSDDPATPIKVVTLKGEAPVSDIAISGPTDWGDVAVGKFKDQVINITNTEACDIAITLVCEVRNSMPQQASVEFNLVSPLNYPVIIPGGATLAVRIRFKPERTGPRSAMLFVCGFDPQVAGGTAEKCPASSYLKRTVVLTGKGK